MPATLIELSLRKSNRPYVKWLIERDLTTGQDRPPHLGTSAFSDGFYNKFIHQNNQLTKYASGFGIDLGEYYSRFYELGKRASQQLDGPLRDRTWEDYFVVLGTLQNRVLDGILQKKTQQRNTELEQLVAEEETRQELSLEDIERVRKMSETLKQVPVKDYKQDQFGLRLFDQRVVYVADQDPNRYLRDNYWSVDPSLRADYLRVVRFSQLNGTRQDYMEAEEEPLREILGKLWNVHGKMFLQAIYTEMARDPYKGFMFYRETPNDIFSLAAEHRDFYFGAVFRAQKAGMKSFVDAIPFAVARLHEKHTSEKAKGITKEAFALFSGRNETQVLSFLERHLIQRRE